MIKQFPDALRIMLPQDQNQKPEDAMAAAMKSLEQQVDQMSTRIQRANDAAQRAQTPASKFIQLMGSGLPKRALELYRSTTDPSVFGDQKLEVETLSIIAEIQAGQIEQAVPRIEALKDQLEPLANKPPNQQVVSAMLTLQVLQPVIPRLAGDYASAAAAFDRMPVQKIPQAEAIAAANLPLVGFGLSALTGSLGSLDVANATVPPPYMKMGQIRQFIQTEAIQQYDRALLALVAGDMRECKKRLEAAADPQGVDIAKLDPQLADIIKQYLSMIQRVERLP